MLASAHISSLGYLCQPRPRVLFPGFGGGRPTSKAKEKHPGDEVVPVPECIKGDR